MSFLTYVKYLIALVITAFLTGISFDFGKLFIGISADEEAIKRIRGDIIRSKIIEDVENPEGFEFSELTASLDKRLKLTGIVSNIGQQDWLNPVIVITVFAEELEIGRCRSFGLNYIKSEEKKKFTVTCDDIYGSGPKIPDFIRYRPRVTEAWYERKQ